MENELKDLLISQFRIRVFEENYTRIFKCLAYLSEDQVWWRPNEESNAIGNLILHLLGNCNQWIGSGLGKMEDRRQRAAEGLARESYPKKWLVEELRKMEHDMTNILERLTVADLVEKRPVQIYEESGLSILVHVIEHFSYHTGQIAYITKLLLEKQLSFYDESKLN